MCVCHYRGLDRARLTHDTLTRLVRQHPSALDTITRALAGQGASKDMAGQCVCVGPAQRRRLCVDSVQAFTGWIPYTRPLVGPLVANVSLVVFVCVYMYDTRLHGQGQQEH